MPSILLLILLLLASSSLIVGVPNVTVIPLDDPTNPNHLCLNFPNGSTGAPFYLSPSNADEKAINGRTTTLNGDVIQVISDSTAYPSPYRCNLTTGVLYLLDLVPYSPVFFTADEDERELKQMASGIIPKLYAHEIAGVRQTGTFLGLDNSTTWAFTPQGCPPTVCASQTIWNMRLLEVGVLSRDGEFEGFLEVEPIEA